jgi:hypothetical protein
MVAMVTGPMAKTTNATCSHTSSRSVKDMP